MYNDRSWPFPDTEKNHLRHILFPTPPAFYLKNNHRCVSSTVCQLLENRRLHHRRRLCYDTPDGEGDCRPPTLAQPRGFPRLSVALAGYARHFRRQYGYLHRTTTRRYTWRAGGCCRQHSDAYFFRLFRDNVVVERVFMGLRPAVVALIAAPVFRMAKSAKIDWRNCWIPILAALLIWLLGVSPVWVILAAIAGGLLYGIVSERRKKEGGGL